MVTEGGAWSGEAVAVSAQRRVVGAGATGSEVVGVRLAEGGAAGREGAEGAASCSRRGRCCWTWEAGGGVAA